MILNCVVTVQQGLQEVTFVSSPTGQTWQNVFLPAFMTLDPTSGPVDPTKYWIANLDTGNGEWLNLSQPWPGPTTFNVPVIIFSDFTPDLNLPLANPGDVNIADLWNRAMNILDTLAVVPAHGPTHVSTGADPIPFATTTAGGLLCKLSGLSTDYIGGDNQPHGLAGVPTGCVMLFCGATLPVNWLLCDGGLYSRTTYANLYATLGGAQSPWGQGDGKTTFNTPDLRGRVPVGTGLGPGLANRSMGQKLGEENHVLTTAEMPNHTHTYVYDDWQPTGGNVGFVTGQTQDTYKLVQAQTGTTGATGGASPPTAGVGKSHNVIQPSTVVQFIIRV